MYSQDQEEIQGRTRFQKMVFLLQQEFGDTEFYDFEAYDYGPFSKGLYDDLDDLIDRDLVKETREEFDENKVYYEYKLTDAGRELIERISDQEGAQDVMALSERLKQEINSEDLSVVLDRVYSEYPEYAENSVLR
jgi:uncharacterized protein YwgA